MAFNKEIDAAVRGNREALSRWMAQRRDAVDATANRLAHANDPVPFLILGKESGKYDQTFAGYADKRMIYHLVDKKPPKAMTRLPDPGTSWLRIQKKQL